MRSLIITALLFLSMCAAISINTNYVKNTAEYITDIVSEEKFSSSPEKAIDELDAFWKKNHPIVGLSVGYKELDKMSDLILDLKTYYTEGNSGEVKRIRILIKEAADEISRLEKISIEALL